MFWCTVKYGLFYPTFFTSVVVYIGDGKQALLNSDRRSAQKFNLRVINGVEDTTNRYPFVVALGMPVELVDYDEETKRQLYPEFVITCSGSLVSEEWVLTASHCIFRGRPGPTRIRYGHMTVAPNDTRATFSDVRKAIRHPSYRDYEFTVQNDIGLLLVNKVHLRTYGRMSAVDYRTLIGLPVAYAGYGLTNRSELDTHLSRQRKSRLYGEAAVVPCSKSVLSQPMICLARKCVNKRQQAYYGDSGGPILHAGRIVGVCSVFDIEEMFKLGMSNAKVMYTAASPFLDWILTTMSQSL